MAMDEFIFSVLLQIDYILVRLIAIGSAAVVIAALLGLCIGAWVLTMKYREGE